MLVRCGAEEILTHARGNIKWYECLGKLQLKIFLPYHSGQPSGERHPERCVHKCTRKCVWTIHNVSNSLVPKWLKLEAAKWLLTEKWINKLCHMHTMEYYPALKRNEWKLHTMTCMNITIIMMIDEWHHFCHWEYHKPCPLPWCWGGAGSSLRYSPTSKSALLKNFWDCLPKFVDLFCPLNCTNWNMLEC